jgi:hypothetical protein
VLVKQRISPPLLHVFYHVKKGFFLRKKQAICLWKGPYLLLCSEIEKRKILKIVLEKYAIKDLNS